MKKMKSCPRDLRHAVQSICAEYGVAAPATLRVHRMGGLEEVGYHQVTRAGHLVVLRNDLTPDQEIIVLRHELRHVAQIETGRLTFQNDRPIWDGRDVADLPYRDQPHERDACRAMHGHVDPLSILARGLALV